MPLDAFDLEAWRELADRDPSAYFVERERTIGAYIAANPQAADRLRRLQAQIDSVRAVAGTPLQALCGIAGMMSEQLDALTVQLRQLNEEADRLLSAPAQRAPLKTPPKR